MYAYIKTLAKLVLRRGVYSSYSQNGEDMIARALFPNTKIGTYIDVGAYHPVLYSNTYVLYRRGWRGIVIDPNPNMQKLFRLVRPGDTFVEAAVGREAGERVYFSFSDGAYNTLDAEEANARKHMRHVAFKGARPVRVMPLRDMLAAQGVTAVDFLNVDIEGMDMEALESYDWSIPPAIIAIESHAFDPDRPNDDPVYRFLRGKGYILKGLANFTLLFRRADV